MMYEKRYSVHRIRRIRGRSLSRKKGTKEKEYLEVYKICKLGIFQSKRRDTESSTVLKRMTVSAINGISLILLMDSCTQFLS